MVRPPIQWRRICRQTIALVQKNFLIFYTSPTSTAIRALIFPLIVTLVLCYLKYLGAIGAPPADDSGIATSSTPVKDLADAMNGVSKRKLVFVLNGTTSGDVEPVLNGISALPGMQDMNLEIINDGNGLYDACRQTLEGQSECYGGVIFSTFNKTNVEYSIALDASIGDEFGFMNWRDGENTFTNRVLPLQWAISSVIGEYPLAAKPSTQAFGGIFGPNKDEYGPTLTYGGANINNSNKYTLWIGLVAGPIAPLFFLILIGVVYHLATFVAMERETSMAELMAAQGVSIVPRIVSTFLSFFSLYFPGFLFSSIVMTQVLFTKTSDILMLFLTLLAGASLIMGSHFLGSFFGKANLAGLYSSTLSFALALITLAAFLTVGIKTQQVTALALLFPPATWATLIGDVAFREEDLKAFSLKKVPIDPLNPLKKVQYLDGYLYIVFFIVQIVLFSVGTYLVERRLWGVTRNFERIEASSDVAVRCTQLSKTYLGKRRWYWPFSRKGKTVVAVDKLDLEVKRGSVTFLLGPNGSGKTTTLKCIAGMVSMDTGSQLQLNESGVIFGVCPQGNVFWRGLTVQQHIKIWRKLKTAADDDDAAADDDDVVAECDLLEKVNAPAGTLSGGQMRKLQLAISFVGGSKVCCIDEASSGLDPLSRRNIWNIIQKGHSRRTVIVTTHFLDEADILADYIAIMYKGKLVCEGPTTSLKARFGDGYVIRSSDSSDGNSMVHRMSNSGEATIKLRELEGMDNDNTYDVVFPTLEQAFLKVTSDTAIHSHGGDGFVGDEETITVIDEKIYALENREEIEMNLEVAQSIGFARQFQALFMKRYILLQQKAGWISYGINLIIVIIIAAALVKFHYQFDPLQTCQDASDRLRNPAGTDLKSYEYDAYYPVLRAPVSPYLYSYSGEALALLAPQSAWSGPTQDELYKSAVGPLIAEGGLRFLGTYVDGQFGVVNDTVIDDLISSSRQLFSGLDGIVTQITNYSGQPYSGFGIYAPTPETATLLYSTEGSTINRLIQNSEIFNLITNRISNSSTSAGTAREITASLRYMRSPSNKVNSLSLPVTALLVLAFICATSISVIYPVYEKVNNVRALHYGNGVSPAALWLGYLAFDAQFILIQSIFAWGVLFAGPLSDLYFESGYIFGIFILFGIATYLGSYLISLFVKKAAFAVAAGIHIFLFIMYLVGYIVNEAAGNRWTMHETYSALQYGLGLSSPAANLARALWVATNTFKILCGKYGDADAFASPGSYERYGSPYVNLIIQILFLITAIGLYEYGSADWLRRNVKPSRLHYIVDSGDGPATEPSEAEKNGRVATAASPELLNVSRVSKFFGKNSAVENASFNICSNETLALLGGNGAGKTTVINMIRGELKPNFGDIYVDGISVLRNPQKARRQLGVCPQDDAVDNLTVRQTLNFYATVKGLKDVSGNVDKVLNALNITSFETSTVAALSGGTRRKLSVAIALLGNPRVLLLDEPSTGQDAGAKRILWKALRGVSNNRAILLTTHSMEEAEALATNVAIMGTKMLATGTLASLQETYGGAYSICAVSERGADAAEVEETIKESFDGVVFNYMESYGQIRFNIPHDRSALGRIMRIMEGLKGNVVRDQEQTTGNNEGSSSARNTQGGRKFLSDYTITGPTLEEVFMNVAKESAVSGEV
ncbi:hypothetical protein V492_07693 [Pseudogymnoascus sp. VKM F-4246]|nr:hypothetical protein V492_07693 [Pseudogymnoascus sp. VKM F-4246]